MASCSACGAPVLPAETADGTQLALDRQPETSGSERYRVIENRSPRVIVERVRDTRPISAYPDHKLDCPAGFNGRRRT